MTISTYTNQTDSHAVASATTSTNPVVSVVVPCYNEAARCDALIQAIRRWNPPFGAAEIILVDDGSTDETSRLLRDELANNPIPNPPVSIVIRTLTHNQGKGGAIRAGVALTSSPYVAFLDADLSVGFAAVGTAITKLDHTGAAVAMASRKHPESVIPHDQPMRRQLGGRLINLAVRGLGLSTSHDTQCGFKLMRGSVARSIFPQVVTSGFAFDVELLARAERANHAVLEIPVEWTHHEGSTVSPVVDGIKMMIELFRIRLRVRKK